jgi:rubredoxin
MPRNRNENHPPESEQEALAPRLTCPKCGATDDFRHYQRVEIQNHVIIHDDNTISIDGGYEVVWDSAEDSPLSYNCITCGHDFDNNEVEWA